MARVRVTVARVNRMRYHFAKSKSTPFHRMIKLLETIYVHSAR